MTSRRIEITDDLLGCIRYRHAMRPTGEIRRRVREAAYGNEVTLRCAECGSFRYDTYDSLGNITVRSYDLAPAYRHALDVISGRGLDRNVDITLEVLRRLRKGEAPTKTRRLRSVS